MTNPPSEHNFAPPTDGTQVPTPLVLAASLAAMVIWPALGIAGGMALNVFERPDEYGLLFGGVTMFAALPLAFIPGMPEITFVVIGVGVWLAALVYPPLRWVSGREDGRRRAVLTLVAQSVFSLAQAGMGLVLLIGKDV